MSMNAAEIFSDVAKNRPGRVALSWQSGELTYAELDAWSDAVAEDLLESKQALDKPAILLTKNSTESIVSIIAAMKAGVVFAPLDMEQAPSRLVAAVDVANPGVVLCDDAGLDAAKWLDLPESIQRLSIGSARKPKKERVPSTSEDGDAPCYIYFTSGSTGEPKGILGRLKSVAHFARWQAREFDLDDSVRCSQLTTPAFDAILRDIFTPLCIGGTVCIPPSRKIIAEGSLLADWLDSSAVTLLHTTPSVLRILTEAVSTGSKVPAALKRVCVAGESLFSVDVSRFLDAFGESVELVNFYGPSETTMIKMFHRVTRKDCERHATPIGQAIAGARALVLDSRLKPCDVDVIGEIYIRTPYRSLGYYQRPDLTDENFVQNPLNDDPADIVYRTGDLGRTLESGDIEYVGRRDRQIKLNGVRIEIAEVENAIRKHEAVQDTVVVEHSKDDVDKSLVAYVVASPEIPTPELRGFMGSYLPVGLIPEQFIHVPTIERTVSGKVNFQALPEPGSSESEEQEYVEPSTAVETELAGIWKDLLRTESPSATVDFFAAGGHSLLAMQVLSRVEAAFAVDVDLRDFLNDPTIRGLASQIEIEILAACSDEDLLELLEEES